MTVDTDRSRPDNWKWYGTVAVIDAVFITLAVLTRSLAVSDVNVSGAVALALICAGLGAAIWLRAWDPRLGGQRSKGRRLIDQRIGVARQEPAGALLRA